MPIKAIRKLITVTRKPVRPITPSTVVIQPNATASTQKNPVKNPRKAPQQKWLELIYSHPLSSVVHQQCMRLPEDLFY